MNPTFEFIYVFFVSVGSGVMLVFSSLCIMFLCHWCMCRPGGWVWAHVHAQFYFVAQTGLKLAATPPQPPEY